MRHHRPKPRRLRRGENRRDVTYHNRLTGWYRVGDCLIHGEARIDEIMRAFLLRGVTVRFALEER